MGERLFGGIDRIENTFEVSQSDQRLMVELRLESGEFKFAVGEAFEVEIDHGLFHQIVANEGATPLIADLLQAILQVCRLSLSVEKNVVDGAGGVD